jgi:ketosteroid isomerase-like protein
MRNGVAITALAVLSLALSGCNKPTPATADSASIANGTASTAFDVDAARAQILAADSAYVRALEAKNVDSLMIYYDDDAVSLGTKAVKGTSDLRNSYTQSMKSNPHVVSFHSEGVNFSNDHSMAWDYGTVTASRNGPTGKPVTSSGTFLNVWKNKGGKWRIVAEISSS